MELRSFKGARAPGVLLPLAVLAVLLVLLVATSATWLFGRAHQASAVLTLVESSHSIPPQSRALPAQIQSVPVYYVGRQDGKLHRESRSLAALGDMVLMVVNVILTLALLDPDYSSAWNLGRVVGVSREGSVVIVNLFVDAFPDSTSDEKTQQAIGRIVQVVHEALDAPDLEVRFTANRTTSSAVFAGGHRSQGSSLLAELWINTPRNDVRMAIGVVTLSGVVQPDAEQPRVLVADSNDILLTSQYAQAGTQADTDGWREWSVLLTPEAGSYPVRVETIWTGDAGSQQASQETRSTTVE